MENFSSLKFLHDAGTVDVRNRVPECYIGEEDDDDSYFELVLNATESASEAEKRVERKNDIAKAEEVAVNDVGLGSNCKAQSPITLLKSAPKFRVMFLGFKKAKPKKCPEINEERIPAVQKHQLHKSPESVRSKRFAVECDAEEVRIASLFSGDSSLRSRLHFERVSDYPYGSAKSSKDFPKYLKLIKPLYERVSKRYSESSRLSSDLSSTDSPCSSPATVASSSPMKLYDKRGERGAGFRALSKRLAKSRSASSTLRMTPSPAANRKDDSLLLQNDGIQSAILHCKRSLYNNTSSQENSTCGGRQVIRPPENSKFR